MEVEHATRQFLDSLGKGNPIDACRSPFTREQRKRIAARFQAKRKQLGMGVPALARLCNVAESTLALVRNAGGVTLETLEKIGRAMGDGDCNWLLEDANV